MSNILIPIFHFENKEYEDFCILVSFTVSTKSQTAVEARLYHLFTCRWLTAALTNLSHRAGVPVGEKIKEEAYCGQQSVLLYLLPWAD